MDYSSNEKLHTLDQIENQIYQMMQYATGALSEFSKDKPSIKNVENQVSQFVKSLENVDNNVSKQLQYLSQVSTLQPHEGSTYSTMKINHLALLRLEHVRSCLTELEHLKLQHQMQLQKYQNSKAPKTENNQQDEKLGMEQGKTLLRPGINIDQPRWDQNTYIGRTKHFFAVTNPLNLLYTNKDLEEAKVILNKYRKGEILEGLTEEKLWRYKNIYDSAFHPDTGEKMYLIGRMSAQVPMNMAITGCMLTYYKTPSQTIFWQWFNQSFNAIVNYTNRSGDSPIPVSQLLKSYCFATSGALVTALSFNSLTKGFPPLIGRFVPFTAVAAANCVNIPMMRSSELINGIAMEDGNGNRIGYSKKMAKEAISQVVLSRILMAAPGMVIPPIIINRLERKGVLRRFPWISAPAQVLMCGLSLTFATPLCCALFPQKKSVPIEQLESEIQEYVQKTRNHCKIAYYNKGL